MSAVFLNLCLALTACVSTHAVGTDGMTNGDPLNDGQPAARSETRAVRLTSI